MSANTYKHLRLKYSIQLGLLFVVFIGLSACGGQETGNKPKVNWNQAQSTELNKQLAAQEQIDIQLYVDRQQHLTFIESGSGLRFAFIKDSLGPEAKSGQTAYVEFKIHLLDGSPAYETKEDELNGFKVDRSEVESGVQEAIKKMSVGDHCEIIVPSHLGHGLVGDLNKIPPLTPLVVDLKLIKLK